MVTATALALRVAARVHDPTQVELTAAQYLAFLNDAIDDLVGMGWLLRQEEDVSITMASSDYSYDVPAGFAYIRWLREEAESPAGVYDLIIPYHQWRLELRAASTPAIVFDSTVFFPRAGKKLQITGQKRPSQSVAGGDTITSGMESFIRERATAYAADFVSGGTSELATVRERIASKAWAVSNQMAAYHPMEFRVVPNGRRVPGR